MKRIYSLLAMLLGMVAMASAQQTWNFQSISSSDLALLAADQTGHWYYDSENDRYCYVAALDKGALVAGGTELDFAKGLRFTCGKVEAGKESNGKVRLNNKNKRLELNGANLVLTIPALKAGQTVTVSGKSANTSAARGIYVAGATVKDGNLNQATTDAISGSATVDADGDVTLTSNDGGVVIYSISVSEASTPDNPDNPDNPDDPQSDLHATTLDLTQNQMLVTLDGNDLKYYNTSSLSSVNIDGDKVTVNGMNASFADTFDGNVSQIGFAKKTEQGSSGEIINLDGQVELIEAKGWLESAYVTWKPFTGADSYHVYVKGGNYASYTQIDQPLVRNYGSYGRADVVGLKAANDYSLKVVPVVGNQEVTTAANEATAIDVRNYSRQGFAFMNNYSPGAYKADGTLKNNAVVIYLTSKNAKTVTANLSTGTFTGIQTILNAYEKKPEEHPTNPLVVRIIGTVNAADVDKFSSSEEGIQIKGNKADQEHNITIEGIGEDATVKGFGFLMRNCKSVEFRNFAVMRCMDDGISLDTDNSNIWIHHMDMFYGKHGSGDHDKGDGAIDVKADSKLVTVSYCRHWDTGKSNMFGMKSESGPNYLSFDHNWFDHSDSRHPRVRTMSVHVWNNYFDNVAKYGVGSCTGASVFVENNYFLKTKKPMLSSLQGTDALGSGTFSGEDGGMIKAYGNYFDRTAVNFRYYTQKSPASTGYDAYETATRDEQVSSSEVTRQGGTPYNNFDTNASVMYAYTPDDAADVPAIVTGYYGAGRMNHGDFSYTFQDNVGSDDADSDYDTTLGSLLDNYKSKLVGIFGESSQGDEPGGDEPGGDEPGGDTPDTPTGTLLVSFNDAPSNSMFTVGGAYGDGKITYDGTYYKRGVKLNSKGSIVFTPTQDYQMTLVLATAKSGRDVRINGDLTTVSGTENTEGAYYEMQPIAITAGTQYTITQGNGESIVMLIKLVPVGE